MTDAHHELGASGAHRWARCSGSVALTAGMPDSSSAAADEGTLAHAIAAEVLTEEKFKGAVRYHPAAKELGEENFAPLQQYVDFVLERAAAGILVVERRLDLSSWIVPGAFGTADAVIYAPEQRLLTMIDLKFGMGHMVYATERDGEEQEINYQLGIYGLGAYQEFNHLDIDEVELIIHQPRREHVSTALTTPEALLAFAEKIKRAVERVQNEPNTFTPGEKQCQWCRAKAVCKARADMHLDAFAREVALLSPGEVSRYLEQAGDFKAWISDLEEHAHQALTANAQAIPGWKLVAGKSQRRWTADAETVLGRALGMDNIYDRKLIGLGAAEKLLGKEAKVIMPTITVKGTGAPTLAPASDPRPPLSDATDGFDHEAE
jgi:hypothetical protein